VVIFTELNIAEVVIPKGSKAALLPSTKSILKPLLQNACFTLQPAQQWSTCTLLQDSLSTFKDREVPVVLKEAMDAPRENAAALAAFAAMHAFLRKSLLDQAVLAVGRMERLWLKSTKTTTGPAAKSSLRRNDTEEVRRLASDGLAEGSSREAVPDTPALLDGAALSNLEVRQHSRNLFARDGTAMDTGW
jgi:hypothetical protein